MCLVLPEPRSLPQHEQPPPTDEEQVAAAADGHGLQGKKMPIFFPWQAFFGSGKEGSRSVHILMDSNKIVSSVTPKRSRRAG